MLQSPIFSFLLSLPKRETRQKELPGIKDKYSKKRKFFFSSAVSGPKHLSWKNVRQKQGSSPRLRSWYQKMILHA